MQLDKWTHPVTILHLGRVDERRNWRRHQVSDVTRRRQVDDGHLVVDNSVVMVTTVGRRRCAFSCLRSGATEAGHRRQVVRPNGLIDERQRPRYPDRGWATSFRYQNPHPEFIINELTQSTARHRAVEVSLHVSSNVRLKTRVEYYFNFFKLRARTKYQYHLQWLWFIDWCLTTQVKVNTETSTCSDRGRQKETGSSCGWRWRTRCNA